MKNIVLLLFILPLLSITSCNNDDDQPQNPIDQLPEATQTGENTFGCLINGEPFAISNTNDLVAIFQQGQLQFGANSEQNNKVISLNLSIIDPLEENFNYTLGENFYNTGYSSITDSLICIYGFNDSIEGNISFSKIDNINYIVSGTFEFTTDNDDCEIVNITNGRFDLQYIP
jgi:uncharacterized protein YaiE (UPF0345 family)